MDRYILVKLDPERDYPSDAAELMEKLTDFAHADVTDLLSYNRSTPNDPWDKPYPAMYAELVERLA